MTGPRRGTIARVRASWSWSPPRPARPISGTRWIRTQTGPRRSASGTGRSWSLSDRPQDKVLVKIRRAGPPHAIATVCSTRAEREAASEAACTSRGRAIYLVTVTSAAPGSGRRRWTGAGGTAVSRGLGRHLGAARKLPGHPPLRRPFGAYPFSSAGSSSSRGSPRRRSRPRPGPSSSALHSAAVVAHGRRTNGAGTPSRSLQSQDFSAQRARDLSQWTRTGAIRRRQEASRAARTTSIELQAVGISPSGTATRR